MRPRRPIRPSRILGHHNPRGAGGVSRTRAVEDPLRHCRDSVIGARTLSSKATASQEEATEIPPAIPTPLITTLPEVAGVVGVVGGGVTLHGQPRGIHGHFTSAQDKNKPSKQMRP